MAKYLLEARYTAEGTKGFDQRPARYFCRCRWPEKGVIVPLNWIASATRLRRQLEKAPYSGPGLIAGLREVFRADTCRSAGIAGAC